MIYNNLITNEQDLRGLDLATVQLQVNGATTQDKVVDFSGRVTFDDVKAVVETLQKQGYTHFCPTIITTDTKVCKNNLGVIAQAMKEEWGKCILGVHLEGPMINKKSKGAHNPELIQESASADFFNELLEASRLDPSNANSHAIVLVTLDPSLDAIDDGREKFEVTKFLTENKVSVSMGHHQCFSSDTFREFVQIAKNNYSIATVTHLYNAWPKPLDRNLMGLMATITSLDIPIQMIVDGRHVTDDQVKTIYQAVGPDRFAIICDESPLVFAEPDKYEIFSGQKFEILAPETPPAESGWPNNDNYPHSNPLSGSTVPVLGQGLRFAKINELTTSEVDKAILQKVLGLNALRVVLPGIERLGRKDLLDSRLAL